LQALRLVRDIDHVTVWARDPSRARSFAEGVRGVPCEVSANVHDAVAQADIAITTTPSRTPLIRTEDLRPGLHITAMGSDAEHKNELAPGVLVSAKYICDRLQQARVLGELHHALNAGVLKQDASFAELGQVIAGTHAGRADDTEITVCDLTGTGAQDTAIAVLALQRARALNVGTIFHNDVTL
jgi:ornithine cyclodeaminase